MEAQRPIRLGVFGPFLRLIKVKSDNAYVELRDEGLFISFGYIEAEVPYANMASVKIDRWPVLGGVGLRVWSDQTMGYIGALGSAVWIALKEAQTLKAGPGSMSLDRRNVALTMVDDEGLLKALEERLQPGA